MTCEGSGCAWAGGTGLRGRRSSGDRSPFTWITYVFAPTISGTIQRGGPLKGGCSKLSAGAQPVQERATHQHPDGLAQSGHVVHRLVEGQPDVVIALPVFDAKAHPVTVETQRADLSAPQRCRQPGYQSRDHVVVVGGQVPEQG